MTDETSLNLEHDGDPFAIFERWFTQARESEPNDANAMALATASAEGAPSVRMVLLKGHDRLGFVFYTNAHSRKGQEIAANPRAALLFHWKSLRRQIRIEGTLEQVDDGTADAYFASRSRDSQLGAVASDQSAPLASRKTFIDRFEAAQRRFEGTQVPRPPHWTGFRLVPAAFEFWLDRPYRLHERHRFVRAGKDGRGNQAWNSALLYP